MRVNVRCCCDPERVLGAFDLSDRLAQIGQTVRWPIRLVNGDVETLALPIARVAWGNGRVELAIKSNDTPIETLRQLPGFIEAE